MTEAKSFIQTTVRLQGEYLQKYKELSDMAGVRDRKGNIKSFPKQHLFEDGIDLNWGRFKEAEERGK